MTDTPFLPTTEPEALVLKITELGPQGQARVENDFIRLADFDREYVNFSGFFGVHGVATFAAAPEMLVALKQAAFVLETLAVRLPVLGPGGEGNGIIERAHAAIAAAEGRS